MYAYRSYYTPYQYTPQNLRERLKEEWYSAKHWRSITDISLTLKDIGSPDAREHYEQKLRRLHRHFE